MNAESTLSNIAVTVLLLVILILAMAIGIYLKVKSMLYTPPIFVGCFNDSLDDRLFTTMLGKHKIELATDLARDSGSQYFGHVNVDSRGYGEVWVTPTKSDAPLWYARHGITNQCTPRGLNVTGSKAVAQIYIVPSASQGIMMSVFNAIMT